MNSAGSDRSTSSSRDGAKRATCRASSDPIDPPAPVTITTLPPRNPTRSCSSSDTVSRCSRSSTRTSRSSLIDTCPLQQVVHRRDHLRLDRDPLADLQDPPQLRLRRVRDRDDHLVDPERGHERRQRLGRPQHLQPVDHRPLLQRVVVHEPPQVHVVLAAAADLAHRHHPGRPGADEQHRRPRPCRRSGPPASRRRLRSQTARRATRMPSRPPNAVSVFITMIEMGIRSSLQRVRQEEAKAQEDAAEPSAGADEGRHLRHPDVLPDERRAPRSGRAPRTGRPAPGAADRTAWRLWSRGRRTRTAAGRPARRPGPSPPGRTRRSCAGRGADGARRAPQRSRRRPAEAYSAARDGPIRGLLVSFFLGGLDFQNDTRSAACRVGVASPWN